ncbi:MAG: hypothetical protein ACE5F5_07540 [Acidimicrobiia bacterium]
MREQDRELIAALVEGRLEDETQARALIASSEEARAEYEAQLLARSALAELGPARMTEAEKAALHRDLWTRLRTEHAPTRRLRPTAMRWSLAAAALLLVVGVAGVLSQRAFTESGDLALVAVQENADGEEAITEAPAVTMAPAAPEAGTAEDQFQAARTASAAADIDLFAQVADAVRKGEFTSSSLDYDYSGALREAWDACLTEAGLVDHESVGDVEGEARYLVAIPLDGAVGPDTPVFFVDADTCTLIHVYE